MAGKELKGREKVVSKMTRDGLTEENLADGSVKDISHKSRGRPPEMKQDFVFDREKKKAQQSDGQGEERNLQKKQIRKSSLRKEAISEEPILEESVLDGEGTGEKNVFGESPKYKKKFREHAQIPEDDSLTGQKKKIRKKQIQLDGEGTGEKNVFGESPKYKKKFREHAQIPEDDSLTGQKKKIRKKQIQKQMRKEQTKSGRLSFDDEENQMVKGPGMKPGRTIGRYAVRDAVSKGVSDPEEEEQDVATETVQFAERGLDGEGTGEKNVFGESPKYKKKFREHAQIPEDDSLTGQKKKIRKKQIQKQMRKEQTKSGRLSFDDEENQMVKGPGMKPGRTIGRYAVRDAVSKGVSDPEEEEQDVATETVQFAERGNVATETVQFAERGTETAVRGLRYAQLRSQRADVKANRRGYHLDETGEQLKFGMSDSMGKAGAEETVKRSEEKKRVLNRFFQRKRYKDAYRAARTDRKNCRQCRWGGNCCRC